MNEMQRSVQHHCDYFEVHIPTEKDSVKAGTDLFINQPKRRPDLFINQPKERQRVASFENFKQITSLNFG